MRLNDAKRVILLRYNSEIKQVEFRHYCVHVRQVGLTRSIKNLIMAKVPDLSNLTDIADYVTR